MEELSGDIETFKNDVSRFSAIHKQIQDAEARIKPIKETISELKKEKTELKSEICLYMDTNEIEKCNLPDNGSITFKKRKTVIPINKQTIRDDLRRYFCTGPGRDAQFNALSDVQKAESLYKYLYENREYKFSNVLTTKT
jgi:uncharacterized protein YdcH (DUF465 family)